MRGRSAAVVAALALTALAAGLAPAPAQTTYAPETLERYFRLEWGQERGTIAGYVYNLSNRHVARMQLGVEALDPGGRVVGRTLTWVPRVPANNRSYFEVKAPPGASHRIQILAFDWVDERDEPLRRW